MSLLTGISREAVRQFPFPHLVVENALDAALCDQLTAEFPPLASFTQGRSSRENKKLARRHQDLLADFNLSPTWRETIEENLTNEAFAEMLRLFQHELRREHPHFDVEFGDPELFRVGRRGAPDAMAHDVCLDATLIIHTPVSGDPCVERGPHLKGARKPFEGFLFLRPESDESDGAEFELYDVPAGTHPTVGDRQQVEHPGMRLGCAIPWRTNTLVMLVNTSRSVTRIAPRGRSHLPLQYFNILAELPRPLFQLAGL